MLGGKDDQFGRYEMFTNCRVIVAFASAPIALCMVMRPIVGIVPIS